ncbi:hypothetical protein EDF69_002495 [Sphingomonas sp. JUb134]|nr:hypothetical protein [Sphingomonas sp. JUb134]
MPEQTEESVTVADQVEEAMRRHPGSTARELSAAIFGFQDGYQQRVNPICRKLCAEGRAYREGSGTIREPYRYTYGKPRGV